MFTIKYDDINKPGFQMFLNKIQNFPGFKGRTARRASKLCLNIDAAFQDALKHTKKDAERLGGKIEKGDWAFTDAENAKEYHLNFKDFMQKEVEINCKKLDFADDIAPYEEALKLTPLDYAVLEPFLDNAPED
jgi:hypothetical protein